MGEKLLFKIAETMTISGNLIAFADQPQSVIDHEFGDVLELRRPDGSTLTVESQICFVDRPFVEDPPLVISLGRIPESAAPVGTEVWLLTRRPSKLHRKFKRKDGD